MTLARRSRPATEKIHTAERPGVPAQSAAATSSPEIGMPGEFNHVRTLPLIRAALKYYLN
jgi:hypothetical protein